MRLILFFLIMAFAPMGGAGQISFADMDAVGCEDIDGPSSCITLFFQVR